jgi:hypothetical protein
VGRAVRACPGGEAAVARAGVHRGRYSTIGRVKGFPSAVAGEEGIWTRLPLCSRNRTCSESVVGGTRFFAALDAALSATVGAFHV